MQFDSGGAEQPQKSNSTCVIWKWQRKMTEEVWSADEPTLADSGGRGCLLGGTGRCSQCRVLMCKRTELAALIGCGKVARPNVQLLATQSAHCRAVPAAHNCCKKERAPEGSWKHHQVTVSGSLLHGSELRQRRHGNHKQCQTTKHAHETTPHASRAPPVDQCDP